MLGSRRDGYFLLQAILPSIRKVPVSPIIPAHTPNSPVTPIIPALTRTPGWRPAIQLSRTLRTTTRTSLSAPYLPSFLRFANRTTKTRGEGDATAYPVPFWLGFQSAAARSPRALFATGLRFQPSTPPPNNPPRSLRSNPVPALALRALTKCKPIHRSRSQPLVAGRWSLLQ